MNDPFNIQSLFLFSKVLEEGSFAAVVRKTGIPKATLSRRIQELENQLGAQLLLRTTRSVQPTDIGREFLQRAQTILNAVEDSRNLVKLATQKPQGTLRISAGVEFGVTVLTPLINRYQKKFPEVTVDLDLTGRFVDLAYEGFDLGVRVGPLDDSTLQCRKLGSFTYGLFAAPALLKQHGLPKKTQDLLELPQLAFSRAGQKSQWSLVRGDQFETLSLKPRLVSNNLWVIERAAIDGRGVCFMPRFLDFTVNDLRDRF